MPARRCELPVGNIQYKLRGVPATNNVNISGWLAYIVLEGEWLLTHSD